MARATTPDLRPISADLGDVERAAQSWSDAFLDCRGNNHAWNWYQAAWTEDGLEIRVTQKCTRCESERKFRINGRTREWSRPSIDYSEGYLLKGLGRITGEGKSMLRTTALSRHFDLDMPRRRRKR